MRGAPVHTGHERESQRLLPIMRPAWSNTRYPRHCASKVRKPAGTDCIRFTPELRHGIVDGAVSTRRWSGALPWSDTTREQQIETGFL